MSAPDIRERVAREIQKTRMDWTNPLGGPLAPPSSGDRVVADRILSLVEQEGPRVDTDTFGDAYQCELAAKLFLGELPREPFNSDGLGRHLRDLAARLRSAPTGAE